MSLRIDAHQHYWRFRPADFPWIDSGMPELSRDRLPSDVEPELSRLEIHGVVAVQARQALEETRWLLEVSERHPFILGVVGWVDLCSRDAGEQLAKFSRDHRLVGIRHLVQDEPDDSFVQRRDFQRGLAAVGREGLVYDLLIHPRHLPHAIDLVREFPAQPFVLDHLAKPLIKKGVLSPWGEDLRVLGREPNVYCKLSGMVTEADWKDWKPEDFAPYLDVVLEAFGTDRLLFGSDWPVCTLAATYAQVLHVVEDYIAKLSSEEKGAILGGTAARVYGLGAAGGEA
jgi:L-fuconolactonase